jgi:hypothetical protein
MRTAAAAGDALWPKGPFAAGAVGPSSSGKAGTHRKPNVLFIAFDDPDEIDPVDGGRLPGLPAALGIST